MTMVYNNEARKGADRMSAKQNPAKFYTKGEEIFNSVSHGVGNVLAIGGTGALVALAAALADARTATICLIYGMSMIVLYTMSTLYHAFPFEHVKRIFRVFDHSSIYLLIAGSYTPFTLILLDGSVKGTVICAVVWTAALVGIVLNAISVERFEKVSMLLYVAMGWAVVFAVGDVAHALPAVGFWLLALGGVSYTGGIVFYVWHKKRGARYMHGVWHLFVLAGSVMHYLCILLYVLPRAYA